MKRFIAFTRAPGLECKTRAYVVTLLLLLTARCLSAAELKQETLQAWNEYIQRLDLERENRIGGNLPFLSLDETPDLRRRVQGNGVVVTNHDPRKVPQGMIHYWVGAIFVPNIPLEQAIGVLTNYLGYSEIYKQLLKGCSVLESNGDSIELSVVAVQKAMSVTAAVATDNSDTCFEARFEAGVHHK